MNIKKKDLKDAQNESRYAIEIFKDLSTGDIVYRNIRGVIIKIADKDGVLGSEEAITALQIAVDNLTDGTITTEDLTLTGSLILPDGTVGDLSIKFGADVNNGFYGVSDVQLGVAVEGALVAGFDVNGMFTSMISEQITDTGVKVDGALIKDGSFIGKQVTATATAAGLTTGALTGADQFVTVTSALATDVICLPNDVDSPIGTVIRGWVGANGFELRPIAAEAATATINGVTTSVEAAIPATTFFTVTKVASLTWILTAVNELGAVITAIVPDAI